MTEKDIDRAENGEFVEPVEKKRLMIIPRIICLVAALLIWVYVVNNSKEDYEKTFSLVAIKIEGEEVLASESEMSVYDQSESMVSITVRGLRSDITNLENSEFKAYVDVSSLKESGRHVVPVKLSLPDKVSLVSHTPAEITIYTDGRKTVVVPVVNELINYSKNDNIIIDSITPDITEVSVSGPAAVVSKIKRAVALVDLSSGWITSSFESVAPLQLVDENGMTVKSEFIKVDRETADVSVKVLMSANIPLSWDFAAGFDKDSVKVTPSADVLPVIGDALSVSGMKKINLLTVSDSTPETVTVQLSSLKLPLGVKFDSGAEAVTVRIEKAPPVTTEPVTTAEITTATPEISTSPADETSSPAVTTSPKS